MSALLALMIGTAFAGWSVEGPSYDNRPDATGYAKEAKQAGYKARVVRRFSDGAGWEFVVRVEDLASSDEAVEAAKALTMAVPKAVVVLDEEGTAFQKVEPDPDAKPAKSEGKPAKGDAADEDEDEDDTPPRTADAPWYEEVAEAHGPGLAALSEAERVLIVYTRKLPDGRIARHTYARRGTDLYLKIEKIEGDVAESTTLALDDKAWLTAKGETSTQDLQRSRETIEKFGPTGAVPVVLDIEDAVESHPALATLVAKGEPTKVDGSSVVLFTPKGAETPEVAVGEKDHLVRRLALDGGKRVHSYDKYEEIGGVMIPTRILVIRDGADAPDQIAVEKVELDGELPDAWFAPPG